MYKISHEYFYLMIFPSCVTELICISAPLLIYPSEYPSYQPDQSIGISSMLIALAFVFITEPDIQALLNIIVKTQKNSIFFSFKITSIN